MYNMRNLHQQQQFWSKIHKYAESEYEMLHIDILPKPNFPSGDKKAYLIWKYFDMYTKFSLKLYKKYEWVDHYYVTKINTFAVIKLYINKIWKRHLVPEKLIHFLLTQKFSFLLQKKQKFNYF